jgi:hypothetical protein
VVSEALALHGVSLPMDQQEAEKACRQDIAIMKDMLSNYNDINSIFDLPECKDEAQIRVMQLYVVNGKRNDELTHNK